MAPIVPSPTKYQLLSLNEQNRLSEVRSAKQSFRIHVPHQLRAQRNVPAYLYISWRPMPIQDADQVSAGYILSGAIDRPQYLSAAYRCSIHITIKRSLEFGAIQARASQWGKSQGPRGREGDTGMEFKCPVATLWVKIDLSAKK